MLFRGLHDLRQREELVFAQEMPVCPT